MRWLGFWEHALNACGDGFQPWYWCHGACGPQIFSDPESEARARWPLWDGVPEWAAEGPVLWSLTLADLSHPGWNAGPVPGVLLGVPHGLGGVALRRHLRRCLWLHDPMGQRVCVRAFDARVLPGLFQALTPPQRVLFAGSWGFWGVLAQGAEPAQGWCQTPHRSWQALEGV